MIVDEQTPRRDLAETEPITVCQRRMGRLVGPIETETCRDGRSRYFLRLGFFADPVSAKQVAAQVRAHFASAASEYTSEATRWMWSNKDEEVVSVWRPRTLRPRPHNTELSCKGRALRGCYFRQQPRANSHNAARRPCPGRRRRRRSRLEPSRYRAKALDRAEHGVTMAGLPTPVRPT